MFHILAVDHFSGRSSIQYVLSLRTTKADNIAASDLVYRTCVVGEINFGPR